MRLQRGESLIGLMMGMTLGLLVLAAGSRLFAHLQQTQRTRLQSSQSRQDVEFALNRLARELQDAQYVGQAWRTRSQDRCDDDFCDSSSDFTLLSDRLEFTLDRNHDGRQDNNECGGLKVAQGAVYLRSGCQNSGWQALSDSTTVTVEGLQLQLSCSVATGWLRRQVDIQLQIHPPGKPERPVRLRRTVVLRNLLPRAVQPLYCP